MFSTHLNLINFKIMQMNIVLRFTPAQWFLKPLFALAITLFAGQAFSQPINDEPCDAIELQVGTTCTYEQYTTLDATSTLGVPDPTCGNYQGNDVWFQVTVPAEGALIFDTNTGDLTDADMAVYSGDCNNLVQVACDDFSSPNGLMPMISLNGLTPGETLWIRIWSWSNLQSGTFSICVTTPPPPPTNDEPCDAIDLTVNTTCTYETYNNSSATGTLGVPDPTCSNYQSKDIWFQVTVPAEGNLIIDTQTGTMTDAAMAVYSGDCNNLVQVACDDDSSPNGLMPKITLTGLNPGDVLWVRVWPYGSGTGGSFGICASIPPPPPTNDEPCDAIDLTVNTTCTYETYDNSSATGTLGIPNPTCSNYQGGDIWFQVTVPAGGSLILDTQTGSMTDAAMAVYSGDCNNLVQIACDDDSSPNGLMPMIALFNQNPGDVLWVRIWAYGNYNPGSFGICASIPPPPPANDNCDAAENLTVNADLNCGVVSAGTTVSATPSVDPIPTPSCSPAGAGDDVWYSFVATTSAHSITFSNVTGGTTLLASEVYGGSCTALTSMGCFTNNNYSVGGLTPGETYYVRVWTTSTSTTLGANFNICVGTPPPPPSNDDPCGAILLTANPTCNYETYTTTSATASGTAPAPGCANYQGGDVWFKVVIPDAGGGVGGVQITTQRFTPAGVTDGGMAVYSGSCGNLALLACNDDGAGNLMPAINQGGLTPGDTLWIRFWAYGNYSSGNFNICVKIPPPPPTNDEPCNATQLIASEDGTCTMQTFYTNGATASPNVPAPGCANYQGGDVWFKVVVPCTGSLMVSTQAITLTDGGMAAYSGPCDNLTLITCNDDGAGNLMPMLNLQNLTPGDTIWVRFWRYGNTAAGDFGICAAIPPPPPPASNCATAQPFCASQPFTVPNITGQPNTNGSGPYGCLFTIPNPTYYYLQIDDPGDLHIHIEQHNLTGTLIDVDFVLWGPFNTLGEACNGISAANIIDCSYSAAGTEDVDIYGAVSGQYYLLLVTNYSNQPGSITYNQTSGTGTTSCDIVCTTEAHNTGPVCANGTFDLTSSTVQDATYNWTGPNCWSSDEQNPSGVTAPSQPGTYTYTIMTTASNGSACADTTRLTVLDSPHFADTSVSVCQGSTVNLNDQYDLTGVTPVWTLNGDPVDDPTSIDQSGVYQLIGTNTGGCADTATVDVVVDVVGANASFQQVPCTQTAVIVADVTSGIPPYEYALGSAPGVFQPENQFTVEAAGSYQVIVKDSLGCTFTTGVDVTLLPPFSVDAGDSATIIIGDAVTLTSSANQPVTSYLWSPATGLSSATVANPVASPQETTTYTLTATSQQGCEASDMVTVTVIPICIDVKNAFTPNGDGINELWLVYRSPACLRNVSVQVFNRYGHRVYESKNYHNEWDGTYKGKPVPDGTYYAVCQFTLIDGKVVTVKSDVTVLR